MAADPIPIIANDSTAEAIPGAPDPDRQLSRFMVARDTPPVAGSGGPNRGGGSCFLPHRPPISLA
jgi:hypothetical protein